MEQTYDCIDLARQLLSGLVEDISSKRIDPLLAYSYFRLGKAIIDIRFRRLVSGLTGKTREHSKEISEILKKSEQLENEEFKESLSRFFESYRQLFEETPDLLCAYEKALLDYGNLLLYKVREAKLENAKQKAEIYKRLLDVIIDVLSKIDILGKIFLTGLT